MKLSIHKAVFVCFLFSLAGVSYGQCPTTSCATHTSSTLTSEANQCPNTGFSVSGDIDNNSDCEDSNGDNCFQFVITRDNPEVESVTMDIGKGAGCNGEVNTFYTEIEGVCINQGSSGSQNTFTFDFGPSNVINIWLCDGSSGQVSLCGLCFNIPTGMPVELTEFSGKVKNSMVELTWTTASELQNSHFEITRSTNGKNFQNIGTLAGQGNSDITNHYSFLDSRPVAAAYYRLKQVDEDGQFTHSKIIYVERGSGSNNLRVYPSPAYDNVTFQFETPGSKSILTVSDLSGRIMLSKSFEVTNEITYFTTGLEDFHSGIYIVSLKDRQDTQTYKFVVSK